MLLNVGSYVGAYRMLNLIITGQSSSVWEAVHEGKQERFAIKVLLHDSRDDKEQRGFLKHEWEVGKTLSHDRIAKIVELGSAQGEPFLALELFRVPNLKTWMMREPRKLPALLNKCVRQMPEAMAHLHSKGWVHRDIKPDNFLVSQDGTLKLVDFALAVKTAGFFSKLMRKRGKIQGTRSYISPEQIRNQALDARSDIYNLGCTLHELFSGKPPFTGVDTNELLNKHLRNAPPFLETTNRYVTPEFAALVRRMLAKLPKDRPQSSDAILQELTSMKIYKELPPEREPEPS